MCLNHKHRKQSITPSIYRDTSLLLALSSFWGNMHSNFICKYLKNHIQKLETYPPLFGNFDELQILCLAYWWIMCTFSIAHFSVCQTQVLPICSYPQKGAICSSSICSYLQKHTWGLKSNFSQNVATNILFHISNTNLGSNPFYKKLFKVLNLQH